MKNIRPYFVEDITAQIKSAYFACANQADGFGAARMAFVMCLAFQIEPVFIKPEHLQKLQTEFQKG